MLVGLVFVMILIASECTIALRHYKHKNCVQSARKNQCGYLDLRCMCLFTCLEKCCTIMLLCCRVISPPSFLKGTYVIKCLLHICNTRQTENVLVQKQKPFSNWLGLTEICFKCKNQWKPIALVPSGCFLGSCDDVCCQHLSNTTILFDTDNSNVLSKKKLWIWEV